MEVKVLRVSRHLLNFRDQALIFVCLLLGTAGVVYFGPLVTMYITPPTATARSAIIKAPAAMPLARAVPTHIDIEKIGISTSVVPLGLKSNGTMYTPAVPEQTGWYKYSPTPGERGPSIIVGHVDSPRGPAVFWRLGELAPGDIISIARADGTMARFRVSGIKVFDQNNFPTQEVYGNTTFAALRLITCSGTFNADSGHYSNNTVIFAELTK